MDAKTKRGGLDWSAKHNVVTGTVNTAGGLMATSMVGSLAQLPPFWAAAAAGVGAVAHSVAAATGDTSRAGILARAAAWAGGGGWLTYSLATSPWSITSAASLATLSVAGGVTASVLKAAGARKDVAQRRVRLASARARAADDWETRIERVCGIKGAEIIGVEHWETGTGYSLDVNLPAGGQNWRDLNNAAARLAADADLPEGCGVEVTPGTTRRAAIVHVSTVNALAEEAPYPGEATPLSINNPLPLGVHRDGTEAGISLRQDTGIMVGQKGGGKTNQLQVINAGLVRCTDTLVWHIDLNGGGMSLPWIWPWHDGQADVPAIDWVASTPDEAQRMTEAALRIAKGRKVAYRKLRRQAGDDKLPVSPQVPQIVIVIDECAEVIGENTKHRQVANNLEELQRIARAEGVNLVFCGLRATTDVIGSTAILKQARARIGMRMQDPEELNYLFGWGCKATPEDIPYPGCGLYLQDSTGQPRPFKGYRLVGQALEDIAIAAAGLRPALDAPSVDLAGPDYTTRWSRAAHLFTDDSGTDTDDLPAPRTPLDQLAEAGAVFKRVTSPGNGVDWSNPATWPAPAVPGLDIPTTATMTRVPTLLRRLLAVMDDHGADRLHTATLAAALNTTPDVLGTLLPQVGVKALPQPFHHNGNRGRGYSRADLMAVAERIERGEVSVPADVADWPPAQGT